MSTTNTLDAASVGSAWCHMSLYGQVPTSRDAAYTEGGAADHLRLSEVPATAENIALCLAAARAERARLYNNKEHAKTLVRGNLNRADRWESHERVQLAQRYGTWNVSLWRDR